MISVTRPNRRWMVRASVYTVLLILASLYLFPLLLTLNYSFKDKQDLFLSGPLDIAKQLYWGNYGDALSRLNFFGAMGNSLILTSVSAGLLVLLSGMAAYALGRGKGKLSQSIYVLFLAGLLIPAQAIFVPTYMLASQTGLTGHFPGLIFFYVSGHLPFGVFMMTSFFRNVPLELEEAATIDGASRTTTLFRIIFPIMTPAIFTLIVLRSLMIWNDYLMAKLFLSDQALQTITVSIANLFGTYRYNMNIAFAAILISIVPMLAFFLANQKHIQKGLTTGAVKG